MRACSAPLVGHSRQARMAHRSSSSTWMSQAWKPTTPAGALPAPVPQTGLLHEIVIFSQRTEADQAPGTTDIMPYKRAYLGHACTCRLDELVAGLQDMYSTAIQSESSDGHAESSQVSLSRCLGRGFAPFCCLQ